MNENKKFFLQPNKSALQSSGLQYRDVLVYGVLLSYANNNLECYPSLRTISARSKLSPTFISKSVIRLQTAGWIKIEKKDYGSKTYNYYKCTPFEDFKMVPLEIFKSELQSEDLAILLCIRQFYYDKTLVSDINIVDMAKILGISYPVLYQRYRKLKEKGYISVKVKSNTSVSKLESKDFEWRVKIEERIKESIDTGKKNSEDIELLKDIVFGQYKLNQQLSKEEFYNIFQNNNSKKKSRRVNKLASLDDD